MRIEREKRRQQQQEDIMASSDDSMTIDVVDKNVSVTEKIK